MTQDAAKDRLWYGTLDTCKLDLIRTVNPLLKDFANPETDSSLRVSSLRDTPLMPENAKKQHQYFTNAHMSKLRTARYTKAFRAFEDSVRDYAQNYLIKEDKLYS